MEKVIDEIILKDDYRRFIVVSAPGKKDPSDTKMTDELIGAYNGSIASLERVRGWLRANTGGSLLENLGSELDRRMSEGQADPIKAFGEYASGHIMAFLLGTKGVPAQFMDPEKIGFIVDEALRPQEESYKRMALALLPKVPKGQSRPITIIPGFYAYTGQGKLVTLQRGGSDVTGAVVANAIGASVYENWTDTVGLHRADPRILDNPELIGEITFAEARELASAEFKLQEDSLLPLIEKKIPLHVRNTFHPTQDGTLVVYDRIVPLDEEIVGVAGKTGYILLTVSKTFIDQKIGVGRKALRVLEKEGIPYGHSPTGTDLMGFFIENKYLAEPGKLNTVLREMDKALHPCTVTVGQPEARVLAVGLGMIRNPKSTNARILGALEREGIEARVLGDIDMSFSLRTKQSYMEPAVRAIYNEFYG